MLHRIVEVQTRPGYRVWVRFQDGTAGEADLSNLVGKGVFLAWNDPREFRKVYVDEETGTLAWPGGLDVAPDAIYSELRDALPPSDIAEISATRRAR